MKHQYVTCCVNAHGPDITAMVERARDITYATFRKHCDGVDDWATQLGYSVKRDGGLFLRNDWHVSYHKSVYRGRPCYYIRHSAIEHIWQQPKETPCTRSATRPAAVT